MAFRNAVSLLFDWASIMFRRGAGAIYPPGHPLHTFNYEVASSLEGVQRAYLKQTV